jgi:hypothetical protein
VVTVHQIRQVLALLGRHLSGERRREGEKGRSREGEKQRRREGEKERRREERQGAADRRKREKAAGAAGAPAKTGEVGID